MVEKIGFGFKFFVDKLSGGFCLRKRRQRLELSKMRIKTYDEQASLDSASKVDDNDCNGAEFLSEDASASLCDSDCTNCRKLTPKTAQDKELDQEGKENIPLKDPSNMSSISFADVQKHYRTFQNINDQTFEVNLKEQFQNMELEQARNQQQQVMDDTIDALESLRKSNKKEQQMARGKQSRLKTKIAFRGCNDSNLLIPGDYDQKEVGQLPIEQIFSKVRITKLRSEQRKSMVRQVESILTPHNQAQLDTLPLAEVKHQKRGSSSELQQETAEDDKITLKTIRGLVSSYYRFERARQMVSEDGVREKVTLKSAQLLKHFDSRDLLLKIIFRQLSTDKSLDVDRRRCYDDFAVDTVVSSPLISTKFSQYHLSQRALYQLVNYMPVSEEILNAYIKLISAERCQDVVGEDQCQFHIFDTFFYHALKQLILNGTYDFLKLTYYLDKHFMSRKSIVDNSVMIFLVPCKDNSLDFAIIVLDLSNEMFVVYDPVQGQEKKDYCDDITMLKTFVSDYLSYYRQAECESSDDFEEESSHMLLSLASRLESEWQGARLPAYKTKQKGEESKSFYSARSLEDSECESVKQWQSGFGKCTKLPSEFKNFGKGVLIAKFLDLFTLETSPTELQIDSEDSIKKLYLELCIELVSGNAKFYNAGVLMITSQIYQVKSV